MSGRPPHLPRPMTATGGQNPPIFPPFHPAPAPNRYGAPVLPPRPHAPPPHAASGDPAFQFRAPPPRPAPPHQDAPFPSVQNAPPIPFAWFGPPAEQYNQQQQQQLQQQPSDLLYAQPQQNYGLQGSSFHPSQGYRTMPGAPPPPLQQNYVLQGSSLHPPQGYSTVPGPPPPPLQQNYMLQSSSFHPPQGYSAMPQYGTWAPPPPMQQNLGSQSSSLREPQGASTMPQHGAWASQPLHGKRHLEAGDCSDSKRIKKVTMQVVYIPVLDFLDKYPPIEPYEFKVGSTVGSIPEPKTLKTTKKGVSVLDGYVELFENTHAMNKSWGGDFDVTDMLASEEAPFAVTINKEPKLEASRSNTDKDLDKLVTSLVMTRYGENGKRPAYVDDFIARVKKLPKLQPHRRAKFLWIIRHHPLFIESAKRRLVLEDFYKFYKMLADRPRRKLFRRINRPRYNRWHLLIAPKDKFISTVYWKGREHQCPVDHYVKDYSIKGPDDENVNIFPFTSEDGYLAVLLRHFIVHGPHDAALLEVELEELDLIIAYYFGEFLPIFLDEISSITNEHEMLKEILTTYADRRSVSRRAPG